jgi:hypothetical protein
VNEWRPIVKGEERQVVCAFFDCEALPGEVSLGVDHGEFLWIDPMDFSQHELIDNLKPTFEAYLRFLSKRA